MLNPSRLEDLKRKMKSNFDAGKVAGCSLLVCRKGEVTFLEHGFANVERRDPVRRDTIFRLYSMTKPITMTAVMQLYERGLVYLEDPLYEFIPEFRDMPVGIAEPDGSVRYGKPRRPITIKHLLTMTSGLSYPGEGDAGERSLYQALEKMEESGEDAPTLEKARRVAKEACLSFHPGERWKYGLSHDIAAAVVEVVSGQRYGEYLKENIFAPLEMVDTAFFVSPEKHARFTRAHEWKGGAYTECEGVNFLKNYLSQPAYESGGGGLVSTIDDYAHFCEMLLNGGTRRGQRILGRKTIEMMRTDQLTEAQRADFGWTERGYGYGLGMRTHLRPWTINGSAGEFGWDGMMGTWMAVDPAEEMYVVYMQNMMPYNNCGMRLMPILYAALD